MAIPDPHMEEIHVLTYEPRPRTCKKGFQVPRRQDYIEVKWCIDYLPGLPDRWCVAEVLHVSRSPAQDVLATGVLRYLPHETWDEEIHEVEFLEEFGLRRIHDHNDADQCTDSSTANPVTKWQLAEPRTDSSAPSGDEDWNLVAASKGQKAVTKTGGSETHSHEVTSLRAGYSSLVVEVEKVKKELLRQSNIISEMRRIDGETNTCSSAGCALQRLRYKLCLKMQMGVRSISSTTSCLRKRKRAASDQTFEMRTEDGVHVGAAKVRFECTLLQFESVARQIRANKLSGEVVFVPDFAHTQLPLPCSAAFRILFKTFNGLVSNLGVGSLSDKLEMARKCGTGQQGDILRILGTYAFDKADDSNTASIYLGTSCGQSCSEREESAMESSEDLQQVKFPLLTRATRKWNKVDRRFFHPLKLEKHSLPALDESASDMKAFSLTWRRASELGPRIWSKSMTDTRSVFGWLEVCFPYIQVEGEILCREIGAIAGDEEWGHC